MRLFTLLLALLFTLPLAAQDELNYVQVSGIISNKSDNLPIQGVKVTNLTRAQITISNAKGVFSMVAVTGDQIRLSHLGMDAIVFDVPFDQGSRYFQEIKLDIDPSVIEAVVVNGLPSLDDLGDELMALHVPKDPARELAERNPDLFNILDTIEAYEASLLRIKNGKVESSPITWFYEKVYKKIKAKVPKPGKVDKLPAWKEEE